MTLIKPSKRPTLSNYAADAWSDDSRYEGLNAIVQAIADGADQIEEKVRWPILSEHRERSTSRARSCSTSTPPPLTPSWTV